MAQMWNNHETEISKKTSNSYEAPTADIHRAASAAAENLLTLRTDEVYSAPSQTGSLSQGSRRMEEMCLRKQRAQEGRPEHIKKMAGRCNRFRPTA